MSKSKARPRPADDSKNTITSPGGGGQRELAAATLATHIEHVVAAAPPLGPDQRNRLAMLLRAADGAA